MGGRALHGGRPRAPDEAAAGLPRRPRGDDRLRRRQLHRRHQPVHHRGAARPDQDAGRVRRDRPPAGAGPVEAHRPRGRRVAGGRDLRQGRRQRDRLDRGQARARRPLQAQAREGRLQGLPRRRGPGGADHRVPQRQALHLPGAAEEARAQQPRDLPPRVAAPARDRRGALRRRRGERERRAQGPARRAARVPALGLQRDARLGPRVGERQAADGGRPAGRLLQPADPHGAGRARPGRRRQARHRRPRRLVHRPEPLRPARARARLRVERDVGGPGQHRHVRGPDLPGRHALRVPRALRAGRGARSRQPLAAVRRATRPPRARRRCARCGRSSASWRAARSCAASPSC